MIFIDSFSLFSFDLNKVNLRKGNHILKTSKLLFNFFLTKENW
ncbi:MAG: hypothetical protein K0R59_1734 [Sphingobacterium sp.]|jgi:hypothetical protein|nr:hypothetical protein [Sphingobacterium sp.]